MRGGRTRLHSYGPEAAGYRLVFLHGPRGDHHRLEPIVAHLHGLRMLVPDLPGFGVSPTAAGPARPERLLPGPANC